MIRLKLREGIQEEPYPWTVFEIENLLKGRKFVNPEANSLDHLFRFAEQPEGSLFWYMADALFEIDKSVTSLILRVPSKYAKSIQEELLVLFPDIRIEEEK